MQVHTQKTQFPNVPAALSFPEDVLEASKPKETQVTATESYVNSSGR